MSVMGVGGKIVVVLIISVIVTVSISLLSGPVFRITQDYRRLVTIAAALAIIGSALNLAAARGMLSAHRKGQLATGGFYAIFRHPMYTFQILITVPGFLLFFNSWCVMMAVIPTFIAFKVLAKEEERYLEEQFGDQYEEYRKNVLFKFL